MKSRTKYIRVYVVHCGFTAGPARVVVMSSVHGVYTNAERARRVVGKLNESTGYTWRVSGFYNVSADLNPRVTARRESRGSRNG